MIFKAKRTHNGYDSEEFYFEKLHRQLIVQIRKLPESATSASGKEVATPAQNVAQVLEF